MSKRNKRPMWHPDDQNRSYCFNDHLVSLTWLMNSKTVRYVRRVWNRFRRDWDYFIYAQYDPRTTYSEGWSLAPSQLNRALRLAKENHVSLIGF